MPAWIEARACRKSIKIHSDAAALLDDVIGADLAALDEAMERFYLYAATGDRPPKGKVPVVEVNLGHVENCIARTWRDQVPGETKCKRQSGF